ncbi:nuclear transport factor 2 family protein [Allohahella sp. A8]|uniref:nuclear transport factor 2 family protein n=1 Tax=Allohahella sp. A8 TaxID=3141461 RepID=UPI003A811F83
MSQSLEFNEIQYMLEKYFDGLFRADSSILSEVFHPDARYVNAVPSSYRNLTLDTYLKIVDERAAPAESGAKREARVVAIEIIGPHLACVKAEMVMMGRYYTDCLTLIRVDDRWLIITKVFHYTLAGDQ